MYNVRKLADRLRPELEKLIKENDDAPDDAPGGWWWWVRGGLCEGTAGGVEGWRVLRDGAKDRLSPELEKLIKENDDAPGRWW